MCGGGGASVGSELAGVTLADTSVSMGVVGVGGVVESRAYGLFIKGGNNVN